MTIDLVQLHSLFVVVLPALVGVLAGLIRQDKLPNWLNELILYAIVAVVALTQALLDGKLGGDALADFMLVGAYCTAFLNTVPGKQLVSTVQTTTSIGGKVTTPVPTVMQLSDLKQIGQWLAPFLAQELTKLQNAPVAQPVQQQRVQSPVSNPVNATPQNFNPGAFSGYPQGTAIQNPQVLTDQSALYNLATQSVQSVPVQQWQQVQPVQTQVPQSGQGG